MEMVISVTLACALSASIWQWRKEKRNAATARRAMLKAREQRDTAQLKAERATASLREIRPLLELPENVKIVGFSYDSFNQEILGNGFYITVEKDHRFMGSSTGVSWKSATDEALRLARQQEHFRP